MEIFLCAAAMPCLTARARYLSWILCSYIPDFSTNDFGKFISYEADFYVQECFHVTSEYHLGQLLLAQLV